MQDLAGKYALITGAACGIGASLSKGLSRRGCRLLLVDRDETSLKELLQGVQEDGHGPLLFIRDLSLPESRASIFSEIEDRDIHLDIVVNNVGIGCWEYFQNTPWNKIEQIIDTNVKCMTHITKLALPDMLERNCGEIVNISSTGAFIGATNSVCYSATKAYIRIFSETLAMELNSTNINVLCIFPGPTLTPGWQAMQASSNYGRKVKTMTAERVAEEIIDAMGKGQRSLIVGGKNKFNMRIAHWLPRGLLVKVALKRFRS